MPKTPTKKAQKRSKGPKTKPSKAASAGPKTTPLKAPTAEVLTRAEVAERFGMSKSGIRHLEKSGQLTPRRDDRGWVVYEVRQVETIRLERRQTIVSAEGGGPIAAQVFRCLRIGKSPMEIVEALELAPEVVSELVRRYRRMQADTDGIWVSGRMLQKLVESQLAIPKGAQKFRAMKSPPHHRYRAIDSEEELFEAIARGWDLAAQALGS